MIDYLSKFSIKGKTVFVLGGSGLIGAEVSKALASAGALVVVIDVDKEKGYKLVKEISDCKYNAYFEYLDLTKLDQLEQNIDNLLDKYNSELDIFINVSYPKTKDWGNDIDNLTLDSWRKNIDIHLNTYSWISRKIALFMRDHKRKGTIINFGSIYGVKGNDFNLYEGTEINPAMAYSAIKGGIINLTRYLASFFGKYGIRINNICPGGVFDNQNKNFIKKYNKKVPLKRMATSEEIASVVLFLSSEAASYINGATIMVDGGWTAI